MSKRKYMITAFLALCLTVIVFIGITTSTSVYDPWVDLNDDGAIDSTDLGILGVHWSSSGTPIDKTALPPPAYDSGWTTINQGESITLNHDIGSTDVLVEMIGKDSSGNIHKRNYGGNQPPHKINLEGFANPPAYDSGWITIDSGSGYPYYEPEEITLTHGLGTTELFVYIISNITGGALICPVSPDVFQWTDWYLPSEDEITVTGHTSCEIKAHVMIWKVGEPPSQYAQEVGVYWNSLTNTTIDVFRAPNDEDWQQVRVMIWKIQPLP